ncbi:uncharacterized protein F5891DRAFT_117832 [Suillus fuscotomentosus]|uniref:Uncharacterized protein n=1 Tax=Suillus fuscotomentosus TaxID=1912939 RepID=A0AAD4EBY1_9AGAM|nr:uncharacterized protein F5891DRAFT_117832 [Suillus fuscotomentosus]KAG1903136.1 hypothetical protein F5891DRAFT_117832 [Suillus fuscotomentosus]
MWQDNNSSPGPPPYHSRSSEADPLIGPRKPYRRYQSLCVYVAIALFVITFTIVNFSISFSKDSLDPDVRNRIREDWDIELRQHQKEVLERNYTKARWLLQDENRIRLRKKWQAEVEEHRHDMKERRRREEQDNILLREKWSREVEEHKHDVEERRKREEQDNILLREKWGKEVEEHKHDMEERRRREEQDRILLREKWSREVEEHERQVEERRKHEEKERLRLNMFWTDLASHTCTSYATREYTARLVNVPSYYDRRVEACMATPVEIHGAEYTPKWCEDNGPNDVVGHWEVDQHEPDCASYWSWYKDFGCASPGSGQRRIEHYLENIPSGADWKEFCATTPASFNGMHFMGAEICFQKDHGTYGHWVFDDENCK